VEGAAIDENRTGALREQSIDELQSSGLAGATATEEYQGLAALDFEGEIAEQGIVASVRVLTRASHC